MKTSFILKGLATFALFSMMTVDAEAAKAMNGTVAGMPVTNATLTRNGNLMTVDMDLNLGDLKVKGDKAVVLTPVIINGNDSVALEPVSLYSRNRWYQFQRMGIFNPESNDGVSMRYSKRPNVMDYNQSVAYQDWMNGSQLKVNCDVYSCCNAMVEHDDVTLGGYKQFVPQPQFTYMFEVADAVKVDSIQGRAFVDFPVNLTVIYPNYRQNAVELAKIIGTIDSVKNDPDITVTSINIKGFASPEGPYDNNIRLAKGRTEALKTYVQQLYKFPAGFINTSYEPEDWDGLRDYVVKSNIENREGILAIIDSNLAPDPKNTKIQKTYPVQYDFLLKNVYPALRHSDYTIKYNIKKYTTVEEIAAVLQTNPKRLSLDELYVLARNYEPGSREYNDVLETAARLFPNSVNANVNAANAAMLRGDYAQAQNYLSKVAGAPEADYARGNLLMLQGDYNGAAAIFRKLAPSMPQAKAALQTLIEEGVISE